MEPWTLKHPGNFIISWKKILNVYVSLFWSQLKLEYIWSSGEALKCRKEIGKAVKQTLSYYLAYNVNEDIKTLFYLAWFFVSWKRLPFVKYFILMTREVN